MPLLTGSLRCLTLVSDILDVGFLNDVHLAELLPRLVTSNASVTITGWFPSVASRLLCCGMCMQLEIVVRTAETLSLLLLGPLRVMGDLVHRGSLLAKAIPNLDVLNPLMTNERRQQVISGTFRIREGRRGAVLLCHI